MTYTGPVFRPPFEANSLLLEVTVPAFERFERKFGARDPELARSLSAHERAQLEFFRREIAGDAAHALDPVRDLLET